MDDHQRSISHAADGSRIPKKPYQICTDNWIEGINLSFTGKHFKYGVSKTPLVPFCASLSFFKITLQAGSRYTHKEQNSFCHHDVIVRIYIPHSISDRTISFDIHHDQLHARTPFVATFQSHQPADFIGHCQKEGERGRERDSRESHRERVTEREREREREKQKEEETR